LGGSISSRDPSRNQKTGPPNGSFDISQLGEEKVEILNNAPISTAAPGSMWA